LAVNGSTTLPPGNRLARGEVLVVAKGDRLARSLSGYVALIERAHDEGWSIVAADGSIDLTTPNGRAMAAMSAVFAELERDLIADRTKVALQAARDRGKRLGRPPEPVPAPVVADVRRWRAEGETLRTIAARLNAAGPDGVPILQSKACAVPLNAAG
jgi:DNA invertase Pin-like site-specific DNA recombinase